MNIVQNMEEEFRKFVGSNNAVMTINGTAAIHTGLMALGLKKGDRVITTPFTFSAPVDMILHCGATPVFVDIDPKTYCIDPNLVEEAIEDSGGIAGVLLVHLFGNMCDMDKIRSLCDQYNLFVLEDASQALGAKDSKGRFAGTIGDVGTYSFYASKNLWTGGGMLVTDNDWLAAVSREIINNGRNSDGRVVRLGYNYNPQWILAFLGDHMIRLHTRAILAELGTYGPENGYYPYVVYDEPLYRGMGIFGDCPIAEEIARKVREGTT